MGKYFRIVNRKGRDWKFTKGDQRYLPTDNARPHWYFHLDDLRVATVWKDRWGWGFYDHFGVSGVVYGFKSRHMAMTHCLALCEDALSDEFRRLDSIAEEDELHVLQNKHIKALQEAAYWKDLALKAGAIDERKESRVS